MIIWSWSNAVAVFLWQLNWALHIQKETQPMLNWTIQLRRTTTTFNAANDWRIVDREWIITTSAVGVHEWMNEWWHAATKITRTLKKMKLPYQLFRTQCRHFSHFFTCFEIILRNFVRNTRVKGSTVNYLKALLESC